MRIREATIDDAEALAALSGQLGYPTEADAVVRRLCDLAGRNTDTLLAAGADDGRLLGFAHAVARRSIFVDPFVELAALVVDEAARGVGTGAALLAAVEDWARAQGFASVRVRSNVIRERAHRFYLREGYAEKKRQAVFVKSL